MAKCFSCFMFLYFTFIVPANSIADVLVESHTNYSKLISSYQKQFEDVLPGRKIIFMDRDWVDFNVSKSLKNLKDTRMTSRVYRETSSKFIEQKFGYRFGEDYQDYIGGILEKEEAQVLYVHKSKVKRNTDLDICLVSGHRRNQGAHHQIKFFHGLDELYIGEIAYYKTNPNLKMSLNTVNQYTDFHELGHCLDKLYIPTIMEKYKRSANTESILFRHKSEVFAEVFASLYLAKLGNKGHVEKRITQRLMGTLVYGGSSALSLAGDPNSWGTYSSYIYALDVSLKETLRIINEENVKKMSIQELIDLSYEVTEKVALRDEFQHAYEYLFRNRLSTPGWEEMSQEFDFIKLKFEMAQELVQKLVSAVGDLFDLSDKVKARKLLQEIANRLPEKVGDVADQAKKIAKKEQSEKKKIENLLFDELKLEVSESQDKQVVEKLLSKKINELRLLLKAPSEEVRKKARQSLEVMRTLAHRLYQIKKD